MLYVYRASAGSGKTHLLTGFFLRLLFRRDLATPEVGRAALFDEILAVTFTNKATAEMKSRIIEELELLSRAPRQSDYYADLNPGDAEPAESIRRQAASILTRILNDYSDFNISTIDSFFQKIVRSFARELNLQGSYEIELNSDRVLEAAVNAFIDDLNRQTDRDLFEWMLDFSRDRISDGDSWNFKQELLKMSKVLITEEYRGYSEHIEHFTADKKVLRNYVDKMKRMVRDFKTTLRQTGEDGLMLLSRYGLSVSDFNGSEKASFMRCLLVWNQGDISEPTDKFYKAAEDPSTWFAKSSSYYNSLSSEAESALSAFMQQVVRLFKQDYRHYMTAQSILSNIYQLGILADIDRKVREYCADQCVMLLSNTTELLNRLIGTSDAPFIYEKVGAHIRHFMIDEFQDTSGMQWSNFKPLLSESIAEGQHNLIVGDVKQSIYRWRGSDWGLLHSGLDHYESAQRYDDSTTLRTNWRSAAEVIRFNNEFFEAAAGMLQSAYNSASQTPTDVFTRIYADVAQAVPKHKPQNGVGRVQVEFIDGPKTSDKKAAAIERLPQVVIELQQHGYEPKDIAILCRTNEVCTLSVQVLLQYKVDHPDCPYSMEVISDEALHLATRPVVQALVSLLRSLQKPASATLRAIAVSNLGQACGSSMPEALRAYFADPTLPMRLQQIANRPLYEMVEELIGMLPAAVLRREEAFLQAFRDTVLEFINGRTTDLTAFLQWWDENGDKRCISTPSEQNAIRVMTIHQSKGLGMPAVVIPYASWAMDLPSKPPLLWCEPQDPLFAEEHCVLPIRAGKAMPKSIFNREYEEERLRCMIDDLNTAYVALTRAKEALFVLAPTPAKKADGTALERLLANFVGVSSGTVTRGEWVRPETPPLSTQMPASASEIPAEQPTTETPHTDAPTMRRLPRLSLKQSRYVQDDVKVQRGNAIHAALSAIRDCHDVEARLSALYARGEIDAKVISLDEMQAKVRHLISLPQTSAWFADGLTVLNEQTLLARGDVMKRPDRMVLYPDGRAVVIDYKTGQPHKGYPAQVRSYMRLLRQMGYRKVEGYLWYIESDRIDPVA
jgi:ATP-dependent exoDNAse (exonuclease V) beta subunit